MLISSGIPAASIEASWLGDREPLPETGKKDERNRRVEIRLQ
jgi:outer membrane protein OmpA-like peptidoglycan-associated protein